MNINPRSLFKRMPTTSPADRLTRFLLDDLPESEREQVERDCFEDPAAFERLVRTETALVDEYIHDHLSSAARRRFEARYLANPRLHERVDFARLLAQTLDRRADRHRAPVSAFGTWFVPAIAASAAVLLIATLGLWVQNRRLRSDVAREASVRAAASAEARGLQQQLDASREEARRTGQRAPIEPPSPDAPVPPRSATNVFTLTLVAPRLRAPDAGGVRTARIPVESATVNLEIVLAERAYSSYRVTIKSVGGGDVYVRGLIAADGSGSRTRVVTVVPADVLAAGDYVLSVAGEPKGSDPEDIARFLLRIVRN